MNRSRSLIAAALLGAGLAMPPLALAQQTPSRADPAPATTPPRASPEQAPTATGAPPAPRERAARGRDADWEWMHRATKIIGTDVYNRQAEKLGDIDDIVLDPRTGQIRYAVVSVGGFLGVGDRLVAVPWKTLQVDRDKDRYVMDATKERLKTAPAFDSKAWPDMDDPKWSQENQRYYNTPRPVTESAPVPRSRAPSDPAARREGGKS